MIESLIKRETVRQTHTRIIEVTRDKRNVGAKWVFKRKREITETHSRGILPPAMEGGNEVD